MTGIQKQQKPRTTTITTIDHTIDNNYFYKKKTSFKTSDMIDTNNNR